jgi:hypothetical protein
MTQPPIVVLVTATWWVIDALARATVLVVEMSGSGSAHPAAIS